MNKRKIISTLIIITTLLVVFGVVFLEPVNKDLEGERIESEGGQRDTALIRFIKRRDQSSRFGFRLRTADDLFNVFKSSDAKKRLNEGAKDTSGTGTISTDDSSQSSQNSGGSTSSNTGGSNNGGGTLFDPVDDTTSDDNEDEEDSIFNDKSGTKKSKKEERGDVSDCLIEYQVYEESNCTSISG